MPGNETIFSISIEDSSFLMNKIDFCSVELTQALPAQARKFL